MSREQELSPQVQHASWHSKGGAEDQNVSDDYTKHRQLRCGSAGPVLLVRLGVGYVIAGQYAGWNFGLAQAGRLRRPRRRPATFAPGPAPVRPVRPTHTTCSDTSPARTGDRTTVVRA
jgi:hypothetical protein